ncbi:MAG: hypothetical protein H6766_03460 [Candidatus Peribacteria bacterium]|nr:MAG: hypothetical protein H6766_03460 [Candidatus Peribacteria bacterium]
MKQKLISLGLNDNQATVWLAVWQYGLSPASQIGTVTGMERTHAYKILQQLVTMQLVHTSLRGKTTYFYIPDKDVLHTLLDHQKELLKNQESDLHDLSDQLDTLIDPELSLAPPIRQRTGTEGVRSGLQDIIATATRESIRQITFFGSKTLESIATSSQSMGQKWSEFFDALDQHQITIQ